MSPCFILGSLSGFCFVVLLLFNISDAGLQTAYARAKLFQRLLRGLLVRLALQHQLVHASIELRLNVFNVSCQVGPDVGDLLGRLLGRIVNRRVDADAHLNLGIDKVLLTLRECIKLGFDVTTQCVELGLDGSNLLRCQLGRVVDCLVEVNALLRVGLDNVFLALSQRIKLCLDVQAQTFNCSIESFGAHQVFGRGIDGG